MAETAFQTQYRDEVVAGFEARQTLLRNTVTTEAMVKGNQAVFLVADSGGNRAVTRGVNGNIPSVPDNLNQFTATLAEYHDLRTKNRFNIFAGQSDQRAIMQKSSMTVINREIDYNILAELATGTINTGATALTASVALVAKAKTMLGNAGVPFDGQIFGLITSAFEGYIMQTKEFASIEYINLKPSPSADMAWDDKQKMFRWYGINWLVHPNLPGKGTNAEKCYVYHRSAIGHAVDTAGIDAQAGYDGKQDQSWARTTIFMGAKLLQNTGVITINHDGSALSV